MNMNMNILPRSIHLIHQSSILNYRRLHLLNVYLILFLILSSLSISADAIRLLGGQYLEGKIIEESEKAIIFKTSKGSFTIKKSDILEMERPDSKEKIVKPPVEEKISITKFFIFFSS